MEIIRGTKIDERDSALNSIKFISMSHNLQVLSVNIIKYRELMIECSILETVDQYVYNRLQKLRTATLHIVMNLCHSNHSIIKHIMTDSIVSKLINVLISDKPVNKSLVLQTIINIMTFGSDPDFVKLLDLVNS